MRDRAEKGDILGWTKSIVGSRVNNNYYSQGYCVVQEFSTYLCLKDSFRRYLKL